MRFLNWLLDRLIAGDIWINERTGGELGETFSARCWRSRDREPFETLRPVIDWLFSVWGANHCQRSYEKRMQT